MKTPVIIIGWGNAARFFAHKITNSPSFEIEVIASRKAQNCAANKNISLEEIPANFEGIVLLCVSDDAIAIVAQNLPCRKAIIAHCAGSVSIDVLNPFENAAVLYPLQTLVNREEENFPVLIECLQKETESMLFSLAEACHLNPSLMSSADRLKLHLAAVMTNNFTHHLLTSIQEYLDKNKLDAQLLLPLLSKTVALFNSSPNSFDLQTGPAKRNDMKTVDKHLQMLEENSELKALYQFFTNAIQRKN